MIEFFLGNNSNDNAINKDLLQLNNLFVSFFNTHQIKKLYHQIIATSNDDISYCLLICKQENLIDINKFYKVTTYVYDNPLSGNIKKKTELFSAMFKALNKLRNQQKGIQNIKLIIIDDIWQIVPKLTKRNVKQFKQLLLEGAKYQIHFIIGSSLPFRNLLLQLLNSVEEQKIIARSPLNQLRAELIFNPDGMIFFRELNQLNFECYYPRQVVHI